MSPYASLFGMRSRTRPRELYASGDSERKGGEQTS